MYIRVKVTPKAKKEKFEARSETEFVVSVKEPAERNLANQRVQELVADHFGISEGKVRLISGHHHPRKIFSIEDKSVE